MRIYNSRWVQTMISIAYPIAVFGLLRGWNLLSPWVAIVGFLLFCALWRNVRYLLLSTVITCVTSVPLWWLLIGQNSSAAQDILGWYPLIIFNFVVYILLPEILIVWGRNALLKRITA